MASCTDNPAEPEPEPTPAPVTLTTQGPSELYAGIDEGIWSVECSSQDGLSAVDISLRTPGGEQDITIQKTLQASSYDTSFAQTILSSGFATLEAVCVSSEDVLSSRTRSTTVHSPSQVSVEVHDTDSYALHPSLEAYLVVAGDSLVSADGRFDVVLTQDAPFRLGFTRGGEPFSFVNEGTLLHTRDSYERVVRVVDWYLRDKNVNEVVDELRVGAEGIASPEGFFAWVDGVYSREGPNPGEVAGVQIWNRDFAVESSTPGTINRYFTSENGIGPDEVLLAHKIHFYTNSGLTEDHEIIDKTREAFVTAYNEFSEYSRYAAPLVEVDSLSFNVRNNQYKNKAILWPFSENIPVGLIGNVVVEGVAPDIVYNSHMGLRADGRVNESRLLEVAHEEIWNGLGLKAAVPANNWGTHSQSITYNRGSATAPTLYDAKFLRVNEGLLPEVSSSEERKPIFVHQAMRLP